MAFKFIHIIVNMVEILKEIKLSVWTATLSFPPLCWLPTQGLQLGLYTTSGGAKIIDTHTHTLSHRNRPVCMLWAVCALCCKFPAVLHRDQCSFPSTCPPVLTHSDLFNHCQEIRSLFYQTDCRINSIDCLYWVFEDQIPGPQWQISANRKLKPPIKRDPAEKQADNVQKLMLLYANVLVKTIPTDA